MISEEQIKTQALAAGVEYPGVSPAVSVDALAPWAFLTAAAGSSAPWEYSAFDGDKFYGGFGVTQVQAPDYWTLRARSSQLFNDNLYARGLIRRLVTNEINTGLTPEACPDEEILGLAEDALASWTELDENRFGLWAKTPAVCDWFRKSTFGEIQRTARREALIEGDVLVVLRQNPVTRLPSVQLIRGGTVMSPTTGGTPAGLRKGHEIKHGVEFNALGREVAYWIRQADASFKRLPAFGEKSGRRLAWLVYGTDKRLDDVRGQPLLSIVLQSLKEIDRYRDSTQRKAVINSMIALAIEKSEDKMGSLPLTNGAIRRDQTTVTDTADGKTRSFKIQKQIPGLALEELQTGEKITHFGGQGTDQAFGEFEEAIVQAVAWANEIPPEILRLAFSNNYSASQAAINEFKIYLNLVWSGFGETFCSPIRVEWKISEALLGKDRYAGEILRAWRDPQQQDKFAAWLAVDWYGSIKPSTDMYKQAKGSKVLVSEFWSTNAREARILTGTKFSKNIKRGARENQQKADALRPLLELQAEFGPQAVETVVAAMGKSGDNGEALAIDENGDAE